MLAALCAPPPAALAGLRVLVVGQLASFGVRWRALLTANGAYVATASAASAALDLLARARFDLLVTGVELPDAVAHDLVRGMRELAVDTPALAVVRSGALYDRARARAAGFGAHIADNAWPDEIVAAVACVVGRVG
jgi:CheY-like chemotaxis protein